MVVMNFFYARHFNQFVFQIPSKFRFTVVLRSVLGFIGVQGIMTAVNLMPVSTASCIF